MHNVTAAPQALGMQYLQVSALDAVVEERATVLETVSERLSTHVLANYDTFVRGVNEAASVETDLQVGAITCSVQCQSSVTRSFPGRCSRPQLKWRRSG